MIDIYNLFGINGVVADLLKVRPDGKPFEHTTEVEDAMRGLKNEIESMREHLSDPSISEAKRDATEGILGRTSDFVDSVENFLGN